MYCQRSKSSDDGTDWIINIDSADGENLGPRQCILQHRLRLVIAAAELWRIVVVVLKCIKSMQ